jgi:hypothetical protein
VDQAHLVEVLVAGEAVALLADDGAGHAVGLPALAPGVVG